MRFAVIQPMKIPRHKAHTIAVINTWWAMARLGHLCTLMVREMQGQLPEVLRFYGLEHESNFFIYPVGWDRRAGAPWWHEYVERAVQVIPDPFHGVVYTREMGVAQRLLSFRAGHGWKLFLELHNLPSSLSEEMAGQAESEMQRQALLEQSQRESSVEREVLPSVDGIIYISSGLRDMVQEVYGHELPPSSVIPNGAAMENCPPPPLRERNGIAYVGHWQPDRGLETLLTAMTHLDRETLTLVGGNDPEDRKRIENAVAALGIGARVKAIGCLPPPDARKALLRSRVAVMTSQPGCLVGRMFASHTKLFEYMAAGAAIAAVDIPTVRPPLEHMRNALLVPPDRPEEMAAAIRRLLEDDDLAESLAGQALEDVKSYSWDRRAARIHAFAASIMGE